MGKVPILKCEMLHSIFGRIRLSCTALRYLKEYEQEIVNNLMQIDAVRDAKINPVIGTSIVYYNADQLSPDEVLELVEAVISTYSLYVYKKERESKNCVRVQEKRLQEESTLDVLKRIGITGGGLILSTLIGNKEFLPNRGIFSRFSTLPALVSMGLSKSVIKSGIDSLAMTKRPNADTLTAASIITALLSGKGVSALMTILLSDIAELMTVYTRDRTRNVIKEMLTIQDEFAWRKRQDGTLEKVQIKDLLIDDVVLVQTGDKISVDGEVVDGEGIVDQSAITGEFMPAVKRKGEIVFAGTVVKSGNLTIKAQKVGDNTAVSRILTMVEEAPNNKAQIQVYADKFSAHLIPMNFALAGLVYLTTRNVTRAINMLIIDYSCGVRLSTATALSAAIHTAAKNGVLLKGGNFIEAVAEADTLILDKTGTMTEGKPKLVSIITCSDVSSRELVELAGAAEETSSHPLAYSILSKIKKSGWKIREHGEIKVRVARGVETTVEDKIVLVGNKKFMEENEIDTLSLEREVKHLMDRGESVIFVAYDGQLKGILGVQDPLKENMKKALNRLRYLGFDEMKLLTGDLQNQAELVANKMAIDAFESELLPEEKAQEVLSLQAKGSKVIMIGDGINDAPALAYADVGIAIGNTRTDIAIEAADVTITHDEPLLIPATVKMARKTMSIVKQNFATTIAVNTAGLYLGAIGVLPVFWGSVLHNMTTILVVLNSGRLLIYDFDKRGN